MDRLFTQCLIPCALAGVSSIDYHNKFTYYTNVRVTEGTYDSHSTYNVVCDSRSEKFDENNKQTTTICTDVWLAAVPRAEPDGIYFIQGRRYSVSMRQRLIANVPTSSVKLGTLRCQIRSEHYESMESTLVTVYRNTRGAKNLLVSSKRRAKSLPAQADKPSSPPVDVLCCLKSMLGTSNWKETTMQLMAAMGASPTVLTCLDLSVSAMVEGAVMVPRMPLVAEQQINLWGTDAAAEYVVLCQMILKFLQVECGEKALDDRDDCAYKDVELHVVLMAKLLRRLATAAGPKLSSSARSDSPVIHKELVQAITHNRWDVLGKYSTDTKLSRLVDFEAPINVEELLREVVTLASSHGLEEYASDEFTYRMLHPSQVGYLCMVRTGNDKDAGLKSYLASDCVVSHGQILAPLLAEEMSLLKQMYSDLYGFVPQTHQRLVLWTHNHVPMLAVPLENIVYLLERVKFTHPQLGWSVVDGVAESRSYYGRMVCLTSTTQGHMGVDSRERQRLPHLVDTADKYSRLCHDVPYMNMMPIARTTLSTRNIQKSIPCTYHVYPLIDQSALLCAQKPLVTTTKASKHLYGTNVVVAYATMQGYGIQDGIVVNKAAVERGLFSTIHIVCKRWEKLDRHIVDKYMVYVSRYAQVKEGTILATVDYADETGAIHTATMRHEKPYVCNVSDIVLEFEPHANPMNRYLRSVTVMLRRYKVLGVGDKLCSRMGQKAVAVVVCPPEDMPMCLDDRIGGIDIIVDPLSMLSRCTMSQEASSAMGLECAKTGKAHQQEPFAPATYSAYNVEMVDGTTGELRDGTVHIGVEYYMVLKHIADTKVRSSGTSQRDAMTGTISGEACVRFNWQEIAAMLHGKSHELASHVYATDKGYYPYCNTCHKDVDGNTCPTCDGVAEERISVSRSLMSVKKIMSVLSVNMKIEQEQET